MMIIHDDVARTYSLEGPPRSFASPGKPSLGKLSFLIRVEFRHPLSGCNKQLIPFATLAMCYYYLGAAVQSFPLSLPLQRWTHSTLAIGML